ncbi:MAG: formyltransferase family protein [Pseudomonadota bacterium]
MRIYLVIDETPFFHPEFSKNLIETLSSEDQIVGAALVEKIPKKSSINRYLASQFWRLNLVELLALGLKKSRATLLNYAFSEGLNGNYFSVAAVLRAYEIPFIRVQSNINTATNIAQIATTNPDVIISSNSLLFGKKLLKTARYCCINRHSALLPSYGGILPVFHAVANNERETGVTIHKMTPSIDKGEILAQRVVSINSSDTLWTLYKKCFQLSAPALIEALDNLRAADSFQASDSRVESYYTFPSPDDWKRFRKNGGHWV